MTTLRPEEYRVAWIAPLEIEAQAAKHMLDLQHDGRFEMERGDDYVYTTGEMCGHNVIIATLPAGQEYGTGSAAALASQIKKFFPNLWFGLLVGVAAGLPNLERNPPRDIRLGDILVGLSDNDSPALVAYDLGKDIEDNEILPLRRGQVLSQTEPVVRSAIRSIKLDWPDEGRHFLRYYESMKARRHRTGTFEDPGIERDKLHGTDNKNEDCLVERPWRTKSERTQVWYGSIGSGDKLMRNATRRDQLRDSYDLIGLEMEAAGAMNRIPVGVIRGVCDYADRHKNKEWQPYAAAMAAAYAKALLAKIGPNAIIAESATQPNIRELGIEKDLDETPRKRSKHAPADDSSTESDNGSYRKRRRRHTKGRRVVLQGQGNVNVGSGSISIGKNQTFVSRGHGGINSHS
ncbi:putative nacht and wd domain protein [Rosellinia necatrix]|uniref:Putative nacht and wd domain protein n=1 Tax=Rosellinia necatrix TaxID=77044 RepID=A0A1S7UID5_ROSNE|nr:putative nacht and wd domain protein [Rosellinia necatrix]